MRAPLKYLAPLILVPFLACTDTPAEPDTVETTALFSSETPQGPGDWLVANMTCSGGKYLGFIVARELETDLILNHCWPPWFDKEPSWWCGLGPAYAPTADSQVFRVVSGVQGRIETGPGGGTGDWICDERVDISVAELPYTHLCFTPHGDGLRLACELQFYRVIND